MREAPWFLIYVVGIGLAGGVFTSGAFYWDVQAGLIAGGLSAAFGFIGFLVVHLPLRRKEDRHE